MTPPTNTLAPATITQPSPIKRVVLLTVGWLSIALAIVGIPLPVLPTTPFLILAAACFVRTSPRLHERLLSDKRFGVCGGTFVASHLAHAHAHGHGHGHVPREGGGGGSGGSIGSLSPPPRALGVALPTPFG